MNSDPATTKRWAAFAVAHLALGLDVSSGIDLTTPFEHLFTYQPDLYTPRGTPSRGKVRDTKPAPKPRKKERRSPRHTQRRRG